MRAVNDENNSQIMLSNNIHNSLAIVLYIFLSINIVCVYNNTLYIPLISYYLINIEHQGLASGKTAI